VTPEEFFADLGERMYERVRRWFARRVGDAGADDCTQEVFIRCWILVGLLMSFLPHWGRIEAFVWQVRRNVYRVWLRGNRRFPRAESDADLDDPIAQLSMSEHLDLIRTCFNCLNEKQRMAIATQIRNGCWSFGVLEPLDRPELLAFLGVTDGPEKPPLVRGTIASLCYYGRARLRACLLQHGFDAGDLP
jgi:RNA polymerase sigma factor (sigma-70 family)